MTYTAGQTILDDEYNVFATGTASGTPDHGVANINSIWGVGNANKGYGQGTTLAAVAAGGLVTAVQWSTMTSRLTSIRNHQGPGYTPAPATPVTGNTIEILTNLSSGISSGFASVQVGDVYGRTSLSSNTTVRTNSWTTSTTTTYTITFAGGDETRYFFNAGGRLEFTFSRTGGTSHQKNTDWNNLCTDMGTIIFDTDSTSASGSSGSFDTLASGIGYYDLTTTPQTIVKKFNDTGNADYNLNYIQITAKSNGAVGSNGDVGNVITIAVQFVDDATDDWPNDTVDGNLNTTSVVNGPGVAYISNTWGTPTNTGVNT